VTERPQDLVFSLFGEYLLGRADPVWVGGLIELLAPFGLSENAVRTALSRMSRKGWLETERRGRRAFYRLSPRGRRLLEEGAERIYHPPRDEPWDGAWRLVVYSIPEEERELRDRFRKRLAWLGLGSLGGGLWITPHDVTGPVDAIADELGIRDRVEAFRAEHLGFSDAGRLVSRAWNLEAIEDRYEAFVERFEPIVNEPPGTAERAYVRRLELIHAWREFPLVDPYLPRELLPGDWAGDRAARLFDRLHDELTDPADRHLDAVLRSGTAEAA